MFSKQIFDERDLVAVDKEIKNKYEEVVQKNKNNQKINDNPKPSERGEQATLKKLDKMDDL